ncbi:hypothetical protein ACRAWD_18575 [Caulobacter segnis]
MGRQPEPEGPRRRRLAQVRVRQLWPVPLSETVGQTLTPAQLASVSKVFSGFGKAWACRPARRHRLAGSRHRQVRRPAEHLQQHRHLRPDRHQQQLGPRPVRRGRGARTPAPCPG